MTDSNFRLSTTYSSGVWCRDPSLLATLAVFYDEVWFPCPFFFDPDDVSKMRLESNNPDLGKELELSDNIYYSIWKKSYKELFNQHILRITSPPTDRIFSYDDVEQVHKRIDTMNPTLPKSMDMNWVAEQVVLAVHALYCQKPSPELFIPNPNSTSTLYLATTLTKSLFQYRVPQLGNLNAEQILEVREHIKDTKEGFISYIYEMVDEVEDRLKNDSLDEATLKTVQRNILPKYNEFRRQIASKKKGFWANALATGGKFLQIDAAPWTPKFYGQIFEIFFGGADEIEKANAEAKSNSNQAFQYLATLETETAKSSQS